MDDLLLDVLDGALDGIEELGDLAGDIVTDTATQMFDDVTDYVSNMDIFNDDEHLTENDTQLHNYRSDRLFEEVVAETSNYSNIPNIFGNVDADDFVSSNESFIDEGHLGDYSTRPNIFGGDDIFSNNTMVGQTQPNIFGGENVHFFANANDGFGNEFGDVDHSIVFGDGSEDMYYHHNDGYEYIDTDGDGYADLVIAHIDVDGDGLADYTTSFNIDEDGLHYESLTGDGYTYAYSLDDISTFDPDLSESPAVVGHPADAMNHWEDQGASNRCGLYSQKFVIEEYTGNHIDIEKMVDVAQEHGWFSEEGGTSPSDLNKMLDYCGIPNEMSWGNSMEDLHNVLSSGGRAIVSIDADEIWHGQEDGIFSPLNGANHAVEVAGIDYSDPDNPMVILNDSGNGMSGCGEMIPADKFFDAWVDGGCQMVAIG